MKFSAGWVPSHSGRILRRLENDLFPWLGKRPVADITVPELLSVLRRIESRGAVETAHRAKQNCGQVFRYAVATGRGGAGSDRRYSWRPTSAQGTAPRLHHRTEAHW